MSSVPEDVLGVFATDLCEKVLVASFFATNLNSNPILFLLASCYY